MRWLLERVGNIERVLEAGGAGRNHGRPDPLAINTSRDTTAATGGPEFITDRGRPVHVLLGIKEYQRLTGQGRNIADTPAMLDGAGIAVDIVLPPSARIGMRSASESTRVVRLIARL